LISREESDNLTAILKNLNPNAEIIPMVMGQVPLEKILHTQKFDFEQAQQAPGWLQELRGTHKPETQEYGITSFVFTANRPFHTPRFYDYLHRDEWDNGTLLRSKGFFWLATRLEWAGSWSQAGGTMQYGCAGRWQKSFDECRQELVFIGQNINHEKAIAQLNACLLTDEEFTAGENVWRDYQDDFPVWFLDEIDEEGETL
jgi:G3E family GTPase